MDYSSLCYQYSDLYAQEFIKNADLPHKYANDKLINLEALFISTTNQ